MTTRNLIYFVSDVHLGAPALSNNKSRELLFVKWFEEISHDASEIFLMGDIFDFWFEYKMVVPRGYTRVLAKMAECTEKGIKVHFLPGNHDFGVFDYLPSETGAIVHKEPFIAEFSGKKFYLGHGDGLDPGDKAYLLLKKILTSKNIQRLYSLLHPNLAVRLAHRWAKKSMMSKKPEFSAFRGEEEALYKHALTVVQNEKIDFFVFGHRHYPANLPVGDHSRLILLGDWIHGCSFGVFDGENMILKEFSF